MPMREYDQANKDRRHILQMGYEVFPEDVVCLGDDRFSWDTPSGRIAIFDIYYLDSAGYVEVSQDCNGMGELRTPATFRITAAGINLIETPGEIDKRFPIYSISNVGGQVVIGNSNIVNSAVNALENLKNGVDALAVPDDEKKGIMDHINSILSHPLLRTILNAGAGILKD